MDPAHGMAQVPTRYEVNNEELNQYTGRAEDLKGEERCLSEHV